MRKPQRAFRLRERRLGIIYAPRKSASAAALAAAVPLYRVGPEGFKSRAGERAFRRAVPMINWGSTVMHVYNEDMDGGRKTLNYPFHVQLAISKLQSLTKLKEAGVPALEVTEDDDLAQDWVNKGSLVLARKDGLSGGRGIYKVKFEPAQLVGEYDFFAKYWKKTHEYRVHVFAGKAIDLQQKRRRAEFPEDRYDPMIRNYDNGWVFCHDNIKGQPDELAQIQTTAVAAVGALGLDFGAVDILARYGDDGTLRKHVVCEVNTAPGLEGTTLERYVQAIREQLAQ